MSNKPTIYCVDDDELNRELLSEILSEYECVPFHSGQDCLDIAQTKAPDLVLLDIRMPGMNGFETCQKLRALKHLYYVPIIFFSGDTSIETLLAAYEAGADDFINKPFERKELLAKIKSALRRKETVDSVRKEKDAATLTSMELLTAMGEMSAVVHFLQNTFGCRSYASLARNVIQAHGTLGLEIAIKFDINEEKLYYCTDNIENPLEESVFNFIREKGRIIDFGERTVVNYPNLSIIIRNMPVDDKDLHGRIRDHIALIAQGADSKIISLKTDLIIKTQRENLVEIMSEVTQAITDIDADYKGQQKLSESILSTVGNNIEDSFITLGLSDEQEEVQRAIIKRGEEQIKDLYSAGLALDENFESILKKMQETLENNILGNEIEEEDEADYAGESISFF